MSDNMSNLINQISSMINNNEIPEEVKKMMSNLKSQNSSVSDTPFNNNSTQNGNSAELDIETIMKIKNIMDSVKDSKNDPRANLLRSLKPYLKKSRKDKVEQYIQFLGIEKAFETFGNVGGDKKK